MGFRFSGLSWFYAESEDLIGLKLVGKGGYVLTEAWEVLEIGGVCRNLRYVWFRSRYINKFC